MGYTTRFKGVLSFATELTVSDLRRMKELLSLYPDSQSKDANNPPEYIGVEINEELTGLVDNGDEKIYEMEDTLNWLTERMRETCPNFRLSGDFFCVGEDSEVWRIVLDETGKAAKASVDLYADIKAAAHESWEKLWRVLDDGEKKARAEERYPEDYQLAIQKLFDEVRKAVRLDIKA